MGDDFNLVPVHGYFKVLLIHTVIPKLRLKSNWSQAGNLLKIVYLILGLCRFESRPSSDNLSSQCSLNIMNSIVSHSFKVYT